VQEIEERFRSELADVLCHVLLLARHHGVDVEEAIERKWLVWRPDRAAVPQPLGQAADGGGDPVGARQDAQHE
jgi:hypothetical protein